MRFRDALMLASIVTGINVLIQSSFAVVAVFSPLAMLPPGSVVGETTHIFALYAAARTFALTIFVLVSIFMRFGRMLTVLGFLAGIIQFADMWVGIYQADLLKSIGPFVIGCVQLYAVWMLNNAKRERS
jgi:Na+-translocating ferredoxin:NAD+ oxidoreductase RnfA subunit